MDWRPQSPHKHPAFAVLDYSDRFDFPLTPDELWYWQISHSYPRSKLLSWPYRTQGYYHLKNRSVLVKTRLLRQKPSSLKWKITGSKIGLLKRIPFIRAIFITGALSMSNSPENDDIDVMLIVSRHTLWTTRILVYFALLFSGSRRPSGINEHSSLRVKDKLCDNLYLDMDHLGISHLPINQSSINYSTNLFLAHEILQAKCIFDRGDVHKNFLLANSWVKTYLPIAYHETMKKYNNLTMKPFNNSNKKIFQGMFFILNYSLFIIQYLYMRPRQTHEKIGLGFAYFHPRNIARLIFWDKNKKFVI